MNKEEIITKIVNDLPIKKLRLKMSNREWYGWFEECWDKAINFTDSSLQLKEKKKTDFYGWLKDYNYEKITNHNYRKNRKIYSITILRKLYYEYLENI